jgi:hypothetical protein
MKELLEESLPRSNKLKAVSVLFTAARVLFTAARVLFTAARVLFTAASVLFTAASDFLRSVFLHKLFYLNAETSDVINMVWSTRRILRCLWQCLQL